MPSLFTTYGNFGLFKAANQSAAANKNQENSIVSQAVNQLTSLSAQTLHFLNENKSLLLILTASMLVEQATGYCLNPCKP